MKGTIQCQNKLERGWQKVTAMRTEARGKHMKGQAKQGKVGSEKSTGVSKRPGDWQRAATQSQATQARSLELTS